MIGWIVRVLMWRFARRTGPFGLLALFGGPFPRLLVMLIAFRFLKDVRRRNAGQGDALPPTLVRRESFRA